MHTSDAVKFNIEDGTTVSVKVDTPRGGILGGTAVRVSESFRLEFHIDFDEANAMMLKPGDLVTICGMDGKY
jgi:propanediol utilization protein